MTRPLTPLHNAHVETLAHVLAIRHFADSIGEATPAEVVLALDETAYFLKHSLLPQFTAEKDVLHSILDTLVGGSFIARTMQRDHVEIGRLANQLAVTSARLLGAPDRMEIQASLRQALYGLDSVIRLHVALEEDVLLPLMEEHFDENAQRDIVERFELARAMTLHPSSVG